MIKSLGKHTLKVVEVFEKPSMVHPNQMNTIIKALVKTAEKEDTFVNIGLSSRGLGYAHWIIAIFWPWYGQRIGRSIHQFDLTKLIGREAEFELEEREYLGKQYLTIVYPQGY